MNLFRVVMFSVAAIASGWILWSIADAMYFAPRRALLEEIETAGNGLSQLRDIRRNQYPPVRAQIDEIVNRTLGGDQEIVQTELRARLNRIVESIGLAGASVSTDQPQPEGSPARRTMRRNPFRDTVDFVEQSATVSGVGTLEQAMRLIDRIENAPWIKRVDSILVDPKNRSTGFDVTVKLTTLFLPGRTPEDPSQWPAYDDSGFVRLASFVQANHFSKPKPPEPEPEPAPEPADQQPPAPPQPPPFPYQNWRVTGVVEGSRGWEAWLLNTSDNETKTLLIGETLGEAVFVRASDDQVEFRFGESHYLIKVGNTLHQRTIVHE